MTAPGPLSLHADASGWDWLTSSRSLSGIGFGCMELILEKNGAALLHRDAKMALIMPIRSLLVLAGLATIASLGCTPTPTPTPTPTSQTLQAASVASATAPTPTPTHAAGSAEIGKPAPDFTLKDLEGKSFHLAELRGKTIVLEWFNSECPFVKASHTKGSLKSTAKKHTDAGVVWLAINSSGEGRQGAGPEKNAAGKKTFNLDHPILLDTTGAVGHLYGATNTPHLYVIDKTGSLVYKGAIDNSPDGEGESPTGGKLINYVDAALEDMAAGRPIKTSETKAYGCSVKYGG